MYETECRHAFCVAQRPYGLLEMGHICWALKFMEGVDSVRLTRGDFGKQIRGDKQCPFSGVTNYGQVWRKGAGKRCSECDMLHVYIYIYIYIYMYVCMSFAPKHMYIVLTFKSSAFPSLCFNSLCILTPGSFSAWPRFVWGNFLSLDMYVQYSVWINHILFCAIF